MAIGGRSRPAQKTSAHPRRRSNELNEHEIIRIAVRASMAAMGAMLATILALFLMAAVVSPSVNIPGIGVPHGSSVNARSGD
jgi:hypothetical protein